MSAVSDAEVIKRIQANTSAGAMPRGHDAAAHPRPADHSDFIARVTAAVNPKVSNEPAAREPHPMGKRRPDQGKAAGSHGSMFHGAMRGPHQ